MIYVVEPHADDAFLSLGSTIESFVSSGGAVCVVTVFSGTRKRGDEAARYAEAVGASWIGLGATESAGLGSGDSVDPIVVGIGDDRDTRILPLGIQHPEHRAVAAGARDGDWRYVEVPYAWKPMNADEASSLLVGRTTVAWRRPSPSKWRHVPIFKTQAMFFRYNTKAALSIGAEWIVR